MAEPELRGHAARRRALESARWSRAAILELAVRAEYVLQSLKGRGLTSTAVRV
jgi:hypothetical protein